MKIGCHVSITPSILESIKYAVNIGCSASQIFLGSTRSGSLKSKQLLTNEDITNIKNYIKIHNFYLSIHSIYLLNFCSSPYTSKKIKYAQDNLIYDLEHGNLMGAKCVVLHIGVQKDLTLDEAYNNMSSNILYILEKTKNSANDIKLLLETPAGSGTQIATTIPELSKLYNLIISNANKFNLSKVEINKRLGFCVDTAHIFSSGYGIRMSKGINDYLNEFDKLIGLDKVGLIHLNDSKADLNSHHDIHEGIGDGYIFNINKIKNSKFPISIKKKDYLQNLITLLDRCKKEHIPALVLETHKTGNSNELCGNLYSQEIGMLYSLLDDHNWIKKNLNWSLNHECINKSIKTTKKNSIKTNTKTKKLLVDDNNNISLQLYSSNIIIINKLKLIRNYYEKIEKDNIRVLAYGKAILAIKNFPEEIINANQLIGIKSIGPKIIKKINEYLTHGEMLIFKERNILEKLNEYNTKEKMLVSSILGFGSKMTNELNKKGIYTYYDLNNALANNKIKLNTKELIGFNNHLDLIKLINRKDTESVYKNIVNTIHNNKIDKKYNLEIELAGSYPSGKEQSKDIDILIFTDYLVNKNDLKKKGMFILDDIITALKNKNIITTIITKGYGMVMCLVNNKSNIEKQNVIRHVDVRLLPKKNIVFGRLFFTSGKDFNQLMRLQAKKLGYKLNELDLINLSNNKSVFTDIEQKTLTEKDIFNKLNLSYITLQKRR